MYDVLVNYLFMFPLMFIHHEYMRHPESWVRLWGVGEFDHS